MNSTTTNELVSRCRAANCRSMKRLSRSPKRKWVSGFVIALAVWANALPVGAFEPYVSDANTILLDHFDGGTTATISAYKATGQACGSLLPSATPDFSYGTGPNGLGLALTLNPPVGEPAESASYLKYAGGQLLSTPNGTIEFWVYLSRYAIAPYVVLVKG